MAVLFGDVQGDVDGAAVVMLDGVDGNILVTDEGYVDRSTTRFDG